MVSRQTEDPHFHFLRIERIKNDKRKELVSSHCRLLGYLVSDARPFPELVDVEDARLRIAVIVDVNVNVNSDKRRPPPTGSGAISVSVSPQPVLVSGQICFVDQFQDNHDFARPKSCNPRVIGVKATIISHIPPSLLLKLHQNVTSMVS